MADYEPLSDMTPDTVAGDFKETTLTYHDGAKRRSSIPTTRSPIPRAGSSCRGPTSTA